ncbi:MAG: DUF6653 family protein [Pseudomonadota bacterium]
MVYKISENLMGMSDKVWERHANPWSCYTRFSVLPILVLSIWSREWFGLWCLPLIALALFWTWYNPRAFPPPADLDNWCSRGVLGERVFLNRRNEVEPYHVAWANSLAFASLPGAIVLVVGLWQLDVAWTVFGTALTVLPKVWFVDRMVWLYADWLRAQNKELGDV